MHIVFLGWSFLVFNIWPKSGTDPVYKVKHKAVKPNINNDGLWNSIMMIYNVKLCFQDSIHDLRGSKHYLQPPLWSNSWLNHLTVCLVETSFVTWTVSGTFICVVFWEKPENSGKPDNTPSGHCVRGEVHPGPPCRYFTIYKSYLSCRCCSVSNVSATWTGSSTASYTPIGRQQSSRTHQPPLHHPHYCKE